MSRALRPHQSKILLIWLAILPVTHALAAQEATTRIPGVEGTWVIPPEAAMVAPYRGREALWLRYGLRPYREDVAFLETAAA
jgi:hypothetical protein